MAAVKHASGVKLVLKVSDEASPETFTAYCSINAARSLSTDANTNDFNIPDCADPTALATLVREKISVGYSFNGAGIGNTPDIEALNALVTRQDSIKCQVVVDVPSADGGVIFEGNWHFTKFEITGDRGGKLEFNIAAVSDGAITVTANA